MASQARRGSVRWGSRNGMLLAAALVSSAFAWWMIAVPPLTFANVPRHEGHFPLTYIHALGGSGMLLFGGLNLYLAARGDRFALHRVVGRLYLGFGLIGAGSAVVVSLTMAHKAPGTPLITNEAVSLLTLAFAWLAFAALGWRAGRNRRFQSHGHWMIRSYVLAWAFTFCRIASELAGANQLGGGAAWIWLSWVAPMILCELALQWPEGAHKAPPPSL